jgi:hypothetical protein
MSSIFAVGDSTTNIDGKRLPMRAEGKIQSLLRDKRGRQE